jgi:GNAT superfamily N-acetyltransferase
LVFIAELKVKKLYRGQGIGSALLRRMGSMIDLSNCLIGLKAFPLTDDYGKAAKAEEIAQVKHFYELHNFTHAGGEFMVKDARLCDVMKKKLAHRRAK